MTTPGLVVEGLSLSLGAFRLRNISLLLGAGEILVILGPNGAGKSVTLETIAGFHRGNAGRIFIRGRDVTALPPEHRNVGLLFQNFGLFPHLSVAQNVAFGLRARRIPIIKDDKSRQSGNVASLLMQFGIAHLGDRRPRGLSPGEKQRAALARALATQPDLFLFDEPFSVLDARTRDQLRNELLAFLRRTRVPAIFVTHDHTDAMTLADKIVVMRQGEVVQSGTVSEIFRTPAEPFVAEFVGMENVLAGRVADESGPFLAVAINGKILHAAARGCAAYGPEKVRVCIRAEDIYICQPTSEQLASARCINRFSARVVTTTKLGALCEVELDCGFPLRAYVMARQARELNLVPGVRTQAEIAPDAIHIMADRNRSEGGLATAAASTDGGERSTLGSSDQ